MSDTIAAPHTFHLIARHAESNLWLARYMERIENQARLLDVTKTYAHDVDDTRNWLTILRINGDQQEFYARHPEANQVNVARFYLLDAATPTSVQAAIAAARENARTLRALISTEIWLHINRFYSRIRALTEADLQAEHLTAVCDMLKENIAAAYRDYRGHAVPRSGLAFLHDGPASGARGPDHAPAGHALSFAGPCSGIRRWGDRCRAMELDAARGGRLPRLPA